MSTPPPTSTRELILQATWRLLEEQRGQGVRLEDIAHAAGVSRQALYLHFGSRTDLFIATVRYVDEVLKLAERIQQACEAGNGEIGIEAFVALWAGYMPKIRGLARLLLALRDTDADAAAAWADRMRALYDGCRQVVQQLAREAQLAPAWTVATATDVFYALVSLESWEQLTGECGWSNEQYVERMTCAVKRVLLAAPPA